MRAALLGSVGVALLVPVAAPITAAADEPTGAQAAKAEVTLRKGDRGPAVKRLQRRLGVAADGVFGPQTKRAVKRFQRRKGLTADGIVGPLTRRALRLKPFRPSSVRHPRRRRRSGGTGSESAPSGGSRVRLPAVMKRIAECESGGNPRAVSPGGTYRGKWQFTRGTWKAYGGTGDPIDASEAQQDRIAMRLYRARGTAPWPACSRAARAS